MSEGKVNSMSELDQRLKEITYEEVMQGCFIPDYALAMDVPISSYIEVSMPRMCWIDLLGMLKQVPQCSVRDELYVQIQKWVKHYDHPLYQALHEKLQKANMFDHPIHGEVVDTGLPAYDMKGAITPEEWEDDSIIDEETCFFIRATTRPTLGDIGLDPEKYIELKNQPFDFVNIE